MTVFRRISEPSGIASGNVVTSATDKLMELILKHRGKTLHLQQAPCATERVSTLRSRVAGALNADADKTRLLWKGRQVGQDDDGKELGEVFGKGGTVLVLATATASVQQVTHGRPDPTLPDDIEHTSAPRFVAAPRRTQPAPVHSLAGSQYGFASVEALPGFPDAGEVEAILRRLATDRGILSAMEERGWRVGALKEMAPEGRVGVDPVCVLGYNVNRGQEIRLRVRTDDRKGFRSIAQLLHVLAHELAHNVCDQHDDRFKETMRWVERKIKHVDWRGAGGHVLADGSVARAIPTSRIASSYRRGENPTVSNVAALSRLVAEARVKQDARRQQTLADQQRLDKNENTNREDGPSSRQHPDEPSTTE